MFDSILPCFFGSRLIFLIYLFSAISFSCAGPIMSHDFSAAFLLFFTFPATFGEMQARGSFGMG